MISRTQIKGIVRSTDIGVSSDGECMDLLNGRPKNGAIIPIAPPASIGKIPDGYKALYIHATAEFEHIICSNGGNVKVTHKKVADRYMPKEIAICSDTDTATGCFHIGNILVVKFCNKNRYFIWNNNKYEENKLPDSPPQINIREYKSSVMLRFILPLKLYHDQLKNSNPGMRIADLAKSAGLIQGDVLFFVAYRLFDGNVILPSRIMHMRCKSPKNTFRKYGGLLDSVVGRKYEYSMEGLRAEVDVKAESGNKLVSAIELYAYSYSETWRFHDMNAPEPIANNIDEQVYVRKREKTAANVIRDLKGFYLIDSIHLDESTDRSYRFLIGADTSKKYTDTLCYGQYEANLYGQSSDSAADVFLQEVYSEMDKHLTDYPTAKRLDHDTITTRQPFPASSFSKLVSADGFHSRREYLYNGRIHCFGIKNLKADPVVSLFRHGEESGSFVVEDEDGHGYNAKHDAQSLLEILKGKSYGVFIHGVKAKRLYIKNLPAEYATITENGAAILSFERHKSLPFSFLAIDEYGDKCSDDIIDEMVFGGTPPSLKPTEYRNGIIKVSSVNNPMFFPAENTYSFGGKVVGVCSMAEAISEGQFGQYPLYVFTTEGIYALSSGGAGTVYGTQTPLSRDVCSNPNGICPIHGGVVFTTKEHVKIISGSSVRTISEKIEGFLPNIQDGDPLGKIYKKVQQNSSGLVSTIHRDGVDMISHDMMTGSEFADFLGKCTVSYLAEDGLIVLSNRKEPYSYAYDIDSAEWFKWGYSPIRFLNSYPETLFEQNGLLFDAHNSKRSISPFLLVTRPIKFGTDDLKRSNQFAIRGAIKKALSSVRYKGAEVMYPDNGGKPINIFGNLDLYVFGSQNGETFTPITGRLNINHIRDIVTPYNRTKAFRYFCVALVGAVRTNMSLNYIESDIEKTFNNRIR